MHGNDRSGAADRWLLRLALLAWLVAVLPVVAACGGQGAADGTSEGGITVREAWLRPAPAGGSTAAYMVLVNEGATDVRLLGVGFPDAERVEIHETVMEGDIARMVHRAEGLLLPAGSETELAPMGKHVMIVDLARPIEDGASETLVLRFEQAGAMEIDAQVRLGP
jgi:copper(I)-binding protein